MPVDLEALRKCRNTAEARPLLRAAFKEGDYEAVYDGIIAFVDAATANRAEASARLFSFLVPFVSNYVIAARLGTGTIEEWEDAFPDILGRIGVAREESWTDLVLERAALRRDGLREAVEIIGRTIDAFRDERPTQRPARP